jgi:hypothetical protein
MKMHTKYVGLANVRFLNKSASLIRLYFIGKGFANIAIQAQVPIVPLFLANVDEMRWNPILFLWNFFGLGRLFSSILKLNIPFLGPVLLLLSSTLWFLVTFIQIPIPAKLTLYIGEPVQYDMSKDSIDDVSLISV